MKKIIITGLAGAVAGSAIAQRPNIVYIFTDQQQAAAMSCSGNNDLSTPNMDRLAREGVRFVNAYCAAPLSTPSRAAMFTGLPPGKLEQLVNGTPIPEEYHANTLGNLVAAAGYECVYAGKWHLPSSDMKNGTFGFNVLHGSSDTGLADACVKFLNAEHDKPFFLVASFNNPHNICEYVRSQNIFYADLEEPRIEDCPNLPANFAVNPYDADVIRAEQRASYKIYPVTSFTPDDWRRYRNAYYRLVEHVDTEIGKIIAALDKYDNTVVIFTSDHGDGNASHQWNQKSALYEETVNIPFIVRLPYKKSSGAVLTSLVSNGLDLLPTICDYAGATVPTYCKGKSIKALFDNPSLHLRDYLVIETQFDGSATKGWSVRTADYKYVLYDKGKNREQLYDMRTDRGEMVNLAIQKSYEDILQEHRKILAQWHEDNGVPKDRRATPILK